MDDEGRNRALLSAWLAGRYHVVEAEDGEGALAALRAGSVDLVLLDVMMPGLDGIEVCRRIKAQGAERFLPVVLLTALGAQEDRNAGLEAGADEFLTKPVDRRELLLRVSTLLRVRAQQDEIRRQLSELAALKALEDELASLVVHDLRNPLGGILTLLECCRDEGLHGADLEAALAAARRMNGLLTDLLRVRQIEVGARVVEPRMVFLRPLLEEALVGTAPAARARQVRLALQVDADLAARLDPRLVVRAVENLVANAIRYAPRGTVVEVDATAQDDMVHVEVRDRGPGMSAEGIEKVFGRFAGGPAGAGDRPGFGLGLYMVRLVAEGHGGRAEVGAREGGGAVFRLVLRR